MFIFKEGFDLYKEYKEFKKEYDKNNEKDLYIHRMEELFEKLEQENKELKFEIEKLRGCSLELNKDHYDVIKLFLDINTGCFKFMIEEKLESIDMKIAYRELIDNHYIVQAGIGDEENCIINKDKHLDVLKLIKRIESQ